MKLIRLSADVHTKLCVLHDEKSFMTSKQRGLGGFRKSNAYSQLASVVKGETALVCVAGE